MTVSLRLRELREERGWTRAHLAELAGIPATNYGEIESGKTKRIDFKTLAKLADAFHVHARELIADDRVAPE